MCLHIQLFVCMMLCFTSFLPSNYRESLSLNETPIFSVAVNCDLRPPWVSTWPGSFGPCQSVEWFGVGVCVWRGDLKCCDHAVLGSSSVHLDHPMMLVCVFEPGHVCSSLMGWHQPR